MIGNRGEFLYHLKDVPHSDDIIEQHVHFPLKRYVGEGGGHDRISRHVRTPLYRPRGVISDFEIVLHGVILPQLPLFARAGRIYWLE